MWDGGKFHSRVGGVACSTVITATMELSLYMKKEKKNVVQ